MDNRDSIRKYLKTLKSLSLQDSADIENVMLGNMVDLQTLRDRVNSLEHDLERHNQH